MKLFVFILVFGVFVSHPSTPPLFTSHIATSKPNDEDPTVFAYVIELIGPTTIQTHLFGENLRLGEYHFSIREGIEEPERFTLNFDTQHSSGITSEAQTHDDDYPLQPGHTYLLTILELNEPELKKISFVRNSKPVVIRLSVPPDPTKPVISYIDLLLAPDRISLFFEVYGVNMDSLTLIKYTSLSNDVSGSVSVELPTHSSPYLCSSNPIHPDSFFSFQLVYSQILDSIELIDLDSQTIVYPHTVTAAQEDPTTAMILSSILVQLYDDDTAQFYFTGRHLKTGLYKLSWQSTFMDIEYGSATLQFPTQIMTSIVSEKIALSDLKNLFGSDCVAYRIEPIGFAPPIPVVVPGMVSSGVYIEIFDIWSYIPTIASVKCELSTDSSSIAQINVTVLMISAGEYYATFSDENQNQYTVQLWFDQSSSATMSSSSLPISAGPSNTDLVYGAVYTDFKVYWNGIELPSEMTSFTATSDSLVVTVTKITSKHVTDKSFRLEFAGNHVFSGTFEVTFSADGNQPFSKDIEVFALPGTFLVRSEVLEIDGSQFRFETVYTITSIEPKSDRTEILFTQLLFTIPPVRPTPIDDRSIVDLSGSEDLGCGYGTEHPCRNLIQAIQNQIVIPEVFVSYSLLTVEVKNGGIAKEYFDASEISVPLLMWGTVIQGVVPTIEIQSNPQIILTGGSEDTQSPTILDLEFSFASVSGFRPFFVVKGGFFYMQRCVISESNSAHSSFLLVESGSARINQSEIKNIKAIDPILIISGRWASIRVDTVTITNCGKSTSNSLLVIPTGSGHFTNMSMTGCEAEEAPISLSSEIISTFFMDCCWTECRGSTYSGALSFRPQTYCSLFFTRCRWIDCSVISASKPTAVYISGLYTDSFLFTMYNLTFESSDQTQTRPYFLFDNVQWMGMNIVSFLFDYWTEPNMFLMQEGSSDPQPISSLSFTSFYRPVVAPIRHDELFSGVDSPLCGSEDHPCATLGRALSQIYLTDDYEMIVSIYDGGKAEFGTMIENVTVCGDDRTARLVLQPHERGLEESRFFTTRQTIFFRIVIDHSQSTADVLIKHEEGNLEVSDVRFSTTAKTAPTLISASAGTVTLQLVSFDSIVFVSPAISITSVAELSIVSLSSFNTSFHAPLLTVRSLDPKLSQALLNRVSVQNFSFGGSNEVLIEAQRTCFMISECQFVGRHVRANRSNSEIINTDLDFSISVDPQFGYLDSRIHSRHQPSKMSRKSTQLSTNSVCVFGVGAVSLDDCESEISHSIFHSFPSTALSLKGGTTLISHTLLFDNGITSSLPTRQNVLVTLGANLTIHNISSELQSNALWISCDESSHIWRLSADSSERVPFDSVLLFRPVVESVSLSGDEEEREVVIVGDHLIPCNLAVVLIATNTTNETARPIECLDMSTEDGKTLRCSFNDTRMALSSLEWRVSVSCDGFEANNVPVVRRAVRGDEKTKLRGTVLVSVSSVLFGVFGVIGVVLIVAIVLLRIPLRKTKTNVVKLKVSVSTINLQKQSRQTKRTHRRPSLPQRSTRNSLAGSHNSSLNKSSSSSSLNSSVSNSIKEALREMKNGLKALNAPTMGRVEKKAVCEKNEPMEVTDPNKKSS